MISYQMQYAMNANMFTNLIKLFPLQAEWVVREWAEGVEHKAKAYAPKQTGALEASIYRVVFRYNGGASALGLASILNTKANFYPILDDVESPYYAEVASCIVYAWPVNYGHGSYAGTYFFDRAFMEANGILVDFVTTRFPNVALKSGFNVN